MKKTQQHKALRLNYDEATAAQMACRKRYQQNKKQATNHRAEFEKKIHQRRAKKYGTTVEVQEKLTKSTRQQRSVFWRIRRVLDRKPFKPLTTVTYHDEYGVEHECNGKEQVEAACMAEGKSRYTQVYPTPFTSGSLLDDMGFLANTEAADQILEGTY